MRLRSSQYGPLDIQIRWCPVLVSGVLSFDALTKQGLEILQGFEQRTLPGVHFTFGPLPGRALMFWDSTASLPEISHLIGLIATNHDLFER